MPVLPNSDIHTSCLGFGTSGIMGSAITNRGRLKLLNFAYEKGVLHFDTAPLYGMGEAEQLLGRFIKDKRDKLTITTKYGLSPSPLSTFYKLAMPIGRYINRRSTYIRKLIDRTVLTEKRNSFGQANASVSDDHHQLASDITYTKSMLEQKLHLSLKKLGTDYINIYLLHECVLDNLNDDVIKCLNGFVESGKILSYGLATNKVESRKILDAYPEFKGVVQVPNNILDGELDFVKCKNNLFTITHGAFASIQYKIDQYLKTNVEIIKRWSDKLDFDMSTDNATAKMLLEHSLADNDQGIVLFSSGSIANIKANIKASEQDRISPEQIDKFQQLINTEIIALT